MIEMVNLLPYRLDLIRDLVEWHPQLKLRQLTDTLTAYERMGMYGFTLNKI